MRKPPGNSGIFNVVATSREVNKRICENITFKICDNSGVKTAVYLQYRLRMLIKERP